MKRLTTDFLGQQLISPISLTAGAGPWGYGDFNQQNINLEGLAMSAVKGITLTKCHGNPYPRFVELNDILINAIGLDNEGLDYFLTTTLLKIRKLPVIKPIININGKNINEYIKIAKVLNEIKDIDFIELNISCPNVKTGGLNLATDLKLTRQVVKKVKKVLTKKKLIVKLPVLVNDIKKLAVVCQQAGADALALINSIPATRIDISKQKPFLGFKSGGLSGKTIKPIALWAVYQVYQAVQIPIIGIGGISNYEDALEFLMAGARIIALGTALFSNPNLITEIKVGLINYCQQHSLDNINKIIGIAHGK